jgi:hypothetical protein
LFAVNSWHPNLCQMAAQQTTLALGVRVMQAMTVMASQVGMTCWRAVCAVPGLFVCDRKEGLGTLFMMDRQKKYIAEYSDGQPR